MVPIDRHRSGPRRSASGLTRRGVSHRAVHTAHHGPPIPRGFPRPRSAPRQARPDGRRRRRCSGDAQWRVLCAARNDGIHQVAHDPRKHQPEPGRHNNRECPEDQACPIRPCKAEHLDDLTELRPRLKAAPIGTRRRTATGCERSAERKHRSMVRGPSGATTVLSSESAEPAGCRSCLIVERRSGITSTRSARPRVSWPNEAIIRG